LNYPVFIFHELTFRLSEISPEIGAYDSSFFRDNTFVIHTTNGELEVDGETIAKQYENPRLLSREDLDALVQKFHVMKKRNLASAS
jgi:ABC-type methionine transport system ATPase subunit